MFAPAPPQPSTERDALRRAFAAGDLDAFDDLAAPHLDSLYTLALRMVGSAAIAEELVQDALVKAMERHSSYAPDRAFRPWLFTITANVCRDRLRSAWWRKVLPLVASPPSPRPSPEHTIEALDRDAKVRQAMMALPPKYREALALFHLDDLSYAEMTEITGVQVPALKQRVRRGSAMLRERLSRMYPEFVQGRTP